MPDLTNTEKAILQVVVSLTDPSQREKHIAQACGSDASMLRRMQRLLAADDAGDSFLHPPVELLENSDGENIIG